MSTVGPRSGLDCEEAYPMMTLMAPNGVTKIAGAKVYAAKLATRSSASRPRIHDARHTLADDHWRVNRAHTVRPSWEGSLVTMPAHQIGFRKYAKSSAAD